MGKDVRDIQWVHNQAFSAQTYPELYTIDLFQSEMDAEVLFRPEVATEVLFQRVVHMLVFQLNRGVILERYRSRYNKWRQEAAGSNRREEPDGTKSERTEPGGEELEG